MGNKQEEERHYNMTQGELMQLGDEAVGLIDRDAAELIAYGIDVVDRTFIADKTIEFKDFPTDEELEGVVIITTEARNAAEEQMKIAIRSIMVRVSNAFSTSSGEYRRFASKGMNDMINDELYRLGKRVVRTATLYLAELTPEGLTQQIIDDLAALIVAFDAAIDAKEDAVKERDISANSRVKLGNELYDKIVEVYAAGRDYWYTKNEAKYNDYVIYGSVAPQPIKTLTFATDQTIPDKMLFQIKAAADGKKIDADFGDGSPVMQYTVNSIDYTLLGHTFINAGNFQSKLTGEIPAFDELLAPDNKITASNIPEGIKLRRIDMGNNLQTSYNLPDSCDTLVEALFFNNKFDQQSVNAFLIKVNGFNTNNGNIDLSGPDMAAPSGQGIAAKNQLIARGWNVITN